MKRAILLIDHGSRRAEANALLDDVADQVRKRTPESIVEVAHLEISQPDIAQGIDACVKRGATQIVVHPFFLGPGRHTSKTSRSRSSVQRVSTRTSGSGSANPSEVTTLSSA